MHFLSDCSAATPYKVQIMLFGYGNFYRDVKEACWQAGVCTKILMKHITTQLNPVFLCLCNMTDELTETLN